MAMLEKPLNVLMVCTANVCRSPTAHGILLDHVQRLGISEYIMVDSAGVRASSQAKAPEPRATRIAALAGYDISPLRSRKFEQKDFDQFDYILGMDKSHVDAMEEQQPAPYAGGRIARLLDFVPAADSKDIPDPYYGGQRDFDIALKLIEEGCLGFLKTVVDEHFPTSEQLT